MSLLSLNSTGFTISTKILSFVRLCRPQVTAGLPAPVLPEARLFMSTAVSMHLGKETVYRVGPAFELYSMRQINSPNGPHPIILIAPHGQQRSFRIEYRMQWEHSLLRSENSLGARLSTMASRMGEEDRTRNRCWRSVIWRNLSTLISRPGKSSHVFHLYPFWGPFLLSLVLELMALDWGFTFLWTRNQMQEKIN